MRQKILFRADGNAEIGLGHLYRIFALIEMFKADRDYVVLTRNDSMMDAIPAEYPRVTIPGEVKLEDEPAWMQAAYPSSEYMVIADGYEFTGRYQRELKKFNYYLMYIDDLASDHVFADVLVNHSLSARSSDYHAEHYTRLALGTRYAMLRPAFLEAAEQRRTIDKIDTAFVCFGGADPDNITSIVIKALLNIPAIVKINVVAGAAFQHAELDELQSEDDKVHIHRSLSAERLVEVMSECGIGIVPASTVLYELCTVKMPVLSGYYVENQRRLYDGCLENRIVVGGGDFGRYTVADFQEKICSILSERDHEEWTSAQSELFDANIRKRFQALLIPVQYREATSADLMLVHEWANDKVARANSYFSEPISIETHTAWFESKLKDQNALMFIAEVDGSAAGLVRYDVSAENAAVGVLVAAEFRGKGLASTFLEDTARVYFKKNSVPVHAYIKKDNRASIRTFENAGYALLREETVHGAASFVYRLESQDV